VPVAQTDDSLRVESDYPPGDCRADSVADDYSAAADCPAEADSPQDCSYPAAHSLPVDFQRAGSQVLMVEHWADCRGDFRLPEAASAWLAEL
jgi:hypothetical protein